MGSIFEELVRRFNEENNEEAGEHWTPRPAPIRVGLCARSRAPNRSPPTVQHRCDGGVLGHHDRFQLQVSLHADQ